MHKVTHWPRNNGVDRSCKDIDEVTSWKIPGILVRSLLIGFAQKTLGSIWKECTGATCLFLNISSKINPGSDILLTFENNFVRKCIGPVTLHKNVFIQRANTDESSHTQTPVLWRRDSCKHPDTLNLWVSLYVMFQPLNQHTTTEFFLAKPNTPTSWKLTVEKWERKASS